MLAEKCRLEQWPEAFVLPARIGHDPVEIVEQAREKDVKPTLTGGQRRIDRQMIFADQIGDNALTVANDGAVIYDVGELAAGRRRRIENMLMHKWQAR